VVGAQWPEAESQVFQHLISFQLLLLCTVFPRLLSYATKLQRSSYTAFTRYSQLGRLLTLREHLRPIREIHVKRFVTGIGLLWTLLLGLSFAQDSAKQDMKDAGHETKQAAKDTGHAVKTTGHKAKRKTKHAAHKAARKTDEGAQKVEEKTPVGQSLKTYRAYGGRRPRRPFFLPTATTYISVTQLT